MRPLIINSPLDLARLELMSRMGLALITVQQVEHMLKPLTTYFFRGQGFTAEMMLAEEVRDRKKTLGYFLKQLQRRLEIKPEFDGILTEFLDDRNLFIHHMKDVPNFTLDTEEGMQAGIDFIVRLTNRAQHVMHALGGLIEIIGDSFGAEHKELQLDNARDFNRVLALMAFRPKGE
jgi:hypothetical protein